MLTTTCEGHTERGLVAAAQAKVTVTGLFSHPLLLGAGEIEAVMEGGVGATVWMLTVTLVVFVLPALSIAVPLNI